MIHRTFRSLDDRPKLVGFTIRQWLALIAGSVAVVGLVALAHIPGKPAITLLVFTVGLPGALTYVSENDGLQLGRLLGEMVLWRVNAKTLPAAAPQSRPPRGVLVAAVGQLATSETAASEHARQGTSSKGAL